MWRIHFIGFIRPKRINLIAFWKSIDIKIFVAQLKNVKGSVTDCTSGVIFVPQSNDPTFCPWKVPEGSFEDEEGCRRMIWMIFMYCHSYLKCFRREIDTLKKIWELGVTRRAEVVQKMLVFDRNWCDVFISF